MGEPVLSFQLYVSMESDTSSLSEGSRDPRDVWLSLSQRNFFSGWAVVAQSRVGSLVAQRSPSLLSQCLFLCMVTLCFKIRAKQRTVGDVREKALH